jgi:hypothetical protein
MLTSKTATARKKTFFSPVSSPLASRCLTVTGTGGDAINVRAECPVLAEG